MCVKLLIIDGLCKFLKNYFLNKVLISNNFLRSKSHSFLSRIFCGF